jgi:hypothetical protein
MIRTLYGGSWSQSIDYPYIGSPMLLLFIDRSRGIIDKIVSNALLLLESSDNNDGKIIVGFVDDNK